MKKTIGQEGFANLIRAANTLAFEFEAAEKAWVIDNDFVGLAQDAQTLNRLAEQVAGLNRMVLASIVYRAMAARAEERGPAT